MRTSYWAYVCKLGASFALHVFLPTPPMFSISLILPFKKVLHLNDYSDLITPDPEVYIKLLNPKNLATGT